MIGSDLKISTMFKDYYLNHSAVAESFTAELSKFFNDVRIRDNPKGCDYLVSPSYTFTVDSDSETISVNFFAYFDNQIAPGKSFNVRIITPPRHFDKMEIETPEHLQRLVELGFKDVLYKFDEELSKKLASLYDATNKLKDKYPALSKQFNDTSRIVQNSELGVSMITDATFEILSRNVVLKSIDKERVADGPTKLREWELNKFKLNKEKGQTWFLGFNVVSVNPVKGNPNLARLTYVNQYVPKYPYYITITMSSDAEREYLSNLKIGDLVPVVYTAGKKDSGVLVIGWMFAEGKALKPYAIRYLSGQDKPEDKDELRKWNMTKRIVAAAIIAERKNGMNRCIVDNKLDSETQASYIKSCLEKLQDEISMPSDKEIDKQIKILDGKIAKLKKKDVS